MNDFREMSLALATVSHATTAIILYSFKKNGIEKTIEDLQKACTLPAECWEDIEDSMFNSFIGVVTHVSKMIEEKGNRI